MYISKRVFVSPGSSTDLPDNHIKMNEIRMKFERDAF